MGCDIYAFLECMHADKNGIKWEFVQKVNIHRDYTLFSHLAGVKGNNEPISAPRGLPIDCSYEVKTAYERMKEFAHTPSFYMLFEVFNKSLIRNIFPHFYGHLRYITNYDDEFKTRLVFWFDS